MGSEVDSMWKLKSPVMTSLPEEIASVSKYVENSDMNNGTVDLLDSEGGGQYTTTSLMQVDSIVIVTSCTQEFSVNSIFENENEHETT